MTVFRILLHGFVLLLANCVGIFAGFIVYNFVKPANQLAIQLPIAVVLSIVLFMAWSLLIYYVTFFKLLSVSNLTELIGTFIASLLLAPLIFVPLHYFTQGYLTAAGNIAAMFLFQFPVNFIVVTVIAIFQDIKSGNGKGVE